MDIEAAATDRVVVPRYRVFRQLKPWVIAVVIPILLSLNFILEKMAFGEGMKFSVFLLYKNTLAAVFCALITIWRICTSRSSMPKISLQLVWKIVLLSLLECGLDQNLANIGEQYTPASFSTSILAMGPLLTFLVWLLINHRSFNISQRGNQFKIVGLIVVVIGAVVASFYIGPILTPRSPTSSHSHRVTSQEFNSNMICGPILLMVAMIASAVYNNLLSGILHNSLCFLTTSISTIGALINLVVALKMESTRKGSWLVGINWTTGCYLYSGIVISSLVAYLQMLGTKLKDAVTMSVFRPTSIIVGILLFGEEMDVGSVLGGLTIIVGLGCYIWGIRTQDRIIRGEIETSGEAQGNPQPQPQGEVECEIEIEVERETEVEVECEIEIEVEHETKVEVEHETGFEEEHETRFEEECETRVEEERMPQHQPEVEVERETWVNTERYPQPQHQPQGKVDLDFEPQLQFQPESQPQREGEVDHESQQKPQPHPHDNVSHETLLEEDHNFEPQLQFQPQPQPKPEGEVDHESQQQPQPHPQGEVSHETRLEEDQESQLQGEEHHVSQPQLQPLPQLQAPNEVEREPWVEVERVPQVDFEREPQVELEVEVELRVEKMVEGKSLVEPNANDESQVKLEAVVESQL